MQVTLYEDELYEKEIIKEESLQFIVFRVYDEWYAVEITRVKEIVKVETITYLPSSPAHIVGIINLRGNILSVTDLKMIFGFPKTDLTRDSRLVVVESGLVESGILADEVCNVVEVSVSRIEPTLATIPSERAEYIEGEFQDNDKLIGILKIEKVLDKREQI